MTNYLEKDAELIRDLLAPSASPPEDSAHLFVLYALLLRSKGSAVSSEDVHDAWSAWMSQTDPKHVSIRPYSELPQNTQSEDDPYLEAIHRAAAKKGY